jgi:hypothetical protein
MRSSTESTTTATPCAKGLLYRFQHYDTPLSSEDEDQQICAAAATFLIRSSTDATSTASLCSKGSSCRYLHYNTIAELKAVKKATIIVTRLSSIALFYAQHFNSVTVERYEQTLSSSLSNNHHHHQLPTTTRYNTTAKFLDHC